jgi:GNAT superfamily N-acetyltransferase
VDRRTSITRAIACKLPGPAEGRDALRWELRQVADLTAGEQTALRTLSLAVYPPEVAAAWPGRAVEWAAHQWAVVGWDADGAARSYVGLVLRDARWGDRPVNIGGIGGVKTHPAFRRQGIATAALQRALDFFRGQGDVDFGLLACEASLVPFYERLGWRRFPGELFVTQRRAAVPFTFNQVLTAPVRFQEPLTGTINLLGPPW